MQIMLKHLTMAPEDWIARCVNHTDESFFFGRSYINSWHIWLKAEHPNMLNVVCPRNRVKCFISVAHLLNDECAERRLIFSSFLFVKLFCFFVWLRFWRCFVLLVGLIYPHWAMQLFLISFVIIIAGSVWSFGYFRFDYFKMFGGKINYTLFTDGDFTSFIQPSDRCHVEQKHKIK